MTQEPQPGRSGPEYTAPIHMPQPLPSQQGYGAGGGGPISPYVGSAAPAAGGYGPSYAMATTGQPRVGGVHVAIAWVMALVTLLYFLPWAVAATRQKSNTLAIALVNFLLGWTFIGWVVALVMACMAEPRSATAIAYAGPAGMPVPPVGPPAGWYPDASGGRRYWDGVQWTGHTAP